MKLRQFIPLLIAAAVAVSLVDLGVSSRLDADVDRIEETGTELLASLRLTVELENSSEDLTRLARLFVATGDSTYLEYFGQTRAIRNGALTRPAEYGAAYWHEVLAGRLPPPDPDAGPGISLEQRMIEARFSPAELDALRQSLEQSEELALIEERAFALMSGTEADRDEAIRLIVGDEFLQAKADIMERIADVQRLVESRAAATLAEVEASAARLVVLEFVTGGGLLLILIFAGVVIHARVITRVKRLADAAFAVREGDLTARSGVRGSDELGALGKLGDEMVDRLKGSLDELQEMNEVKNKFIGMAAHDLRNPLASIRSFSEIMLETPDRAPDDAEFLGLIHQSSAHMLDLVNELLDVSVIESGRLELKLESTEIRRLIQDRVAVLTPIAEGKDTRLVTEFSDVGACVADPSRIIQVIDNLASNAVKFSPPGTTVTLSLETRNDHVRFSVADEGPGLTDEDQEKMFGEFTRLSARPTGGESSTGLGLSIVKRIVTAHGGDITVNSVHGEGAEFVVRLPVAGPTSVTPSEGGS